MHAPKTYIDCTLLHLFFSMENLQTWIAEVFPKRMGKPTAHQAPQTNYFI